MAQPAPLLRGTHLTWFTLSSIPDLSRDKAPLLRRLSFRNVTINWGWKLLSQLTHLRLEAVDAKGLLVTLIQLPHLQHFFLMDLLPVTLPTNDAGGTASLKTEALPLLKSLTYKDYRQYDRSRLQLCAYFVKHVKIPSETQLHIDIYLTDQSWSEKLYQASDRLQIVMEQSTLRFIWDSSVVELRACSSLSPSDHLLISLRSLGLEHKLRYFNLRSDEHSMFIWAVA